MKNKIYILSKISLALTALMAFLTACEKKELCYLVHPHDAPNCHVELTVKFNTDWDNDDIVIVNTYAGESLNMNTRCVLEFWHLNDDNTLDTLILRKDVNIGTMYDGANSAVIPVDLPSTRIAALCWAEPLTAGNTTNPYFNTSDLRQVSLVEPYGCQEGKDAFTNVATWDYSEHIYEQHGIDLTETIELLRPFGHYTIISNDLEVYYEDNGKDAPLPTSGRVDYQLWIPTMFNVFRQLPANAFAGVKYTHDVTKIDENLVSLGEDYMLIGTKDQEFNYYNCIESTFDGSALIHQSGNIEIKLKRNKHSYIYGNFLTDLRSNSPGIDDSFDEEIFVVIPD